MKIQEFRDKIKQATREQLEYIASDLYKMLPKNKKEADGDNFDSRLEEILKSNPNEKIKIKSNAGKKDAIPFSELQSELSYFFDLVDNDLYIAPNRVVTRTKRSKWRFEVKRFIKELDKITISDENYYLAVDLYKEIYRRLCLACGFYIFPTDTPFSAVGISQSSFLENVLRKYFINGYSKEVLTSMIDLVTNTYVDIDTTSDVMVGIFIDCLPNRTVRDLAIEIAKDRFEDSYCNISSKFTNRDFRISYRKERLLIMILGLYMKNYEGKTGATYFLKNVDNKIDSKYHQLFWNISFFHRFFGEKTNFWLEIYEEAVKKHKFIPGKDLVDEYNECKKSQI